MGKLIYAANTSLDGYLEDETGSFDWSVPDDDVHAFWNEHERHIGTSLYGRRIYGSMRVWDDDCLTGEPAVGRSRSASSTSSPAPTTAAIAPDESGIGPRPRTGPGRPS